jgi:predicted ester cyclase
MSNVLIKKGGGNMKKLLTIIPLVILLCFTFGCQKAEEVAEGIFEEEAIVLLDKVLEIYNEGNLALVDEFYAPEYVSHNYATNEEQVGLDALKEGITISRKAFPDFNRTNDEIFVMGDKTVTRWTMIGTNTGPLRAIPEGELPPTGKKVRVSGVTISRLVSEKIVEEWSYFNVLDVVIQLGWTITPPQPHEPPEEKK